MHSDKANGLSIEYYENGKVSIVCIYKDNLLNGQLKRFDETVYLKQILTYKNGKVIGDGYFFTIDGKLKAFNKFNEDSLYFVRTFKYNDLGLLIDSTEVIKPFININRDSVTGDTVTLIVRIIINDISYIMDSLYLRFDFGKYIQKDEKYTYPKYLAQLNKYKRTEKYLLEKKAGKAFLYGCLEYHSTNGQTTLLERKKVPVNLIRQCILNNLK